MQKNQRGFSLIAALITIVLLATVVIAFTRSAENIRRIAAQSDVAAEEARDLKLLSDAVRSYSKTKVSEWVADQRIEIDIPTLITAGFLPEDFAKRFSAGVGISPLGQPYRIVTLVAGAGDAPVPLKTPRTVITQLGPAPDLALERISIENLPEAIYGVQKRVALSAVRDHRLSAGAIEQGASIVRGINGAFTKDVIAWIGTAEAPFAVSLVGFPDLDALANPNPIATGPRFTNCSIIDGIQRASGGCSAVFEATGGAGQIWEDCEKRGIGYVRPTCPASKVEVKSWTPAAYFSLVDTPIGTLTTGGEIVVGGGGREYPGCFLNPPTNTRLFVDTPTATRYALASLNNVTALRQRLSQDVYYLT